MKVPDVPSECFRGIFGDIVKNVLGPETEATPIAMMATFLAFGSFISGPLPTVVNGEYEHPLTTWFAVIGKSSVGQKGESLKMSLKVWKKAFPAEFQEDSPHIIEGYPQSGASYIGTIDTNQTFAVEEGLWPAPVGFPVLITEEEVVDILDRCKRDSKLGSMSRKGWDGGRLTHRVKINGKIHTTIVDRAKIVVLTHGSPGEWQRKVSESDIAGGTVNRFLFCASSSDTELPFGGKLDQSKVTRAALEVRAYMERAQRHGQIFLGPEALLEWVKAYKEINGMLRADENVSNLIGRSKAYALRLAALFALTSTPLKDSRGRDITNVQISVKDLQSAMAWIRYSAKSVEYAMGAKVIDSALSPLAVKILKAIKLKGPLSAGQMGRVAGGNVPRADIWAAVDEHNGLIVRYENPNDTGGRKGYFYDLLEKMPAGAKILSADDDSDEEEEFLQGEVIPEPGTIVRRPQGGKVPPPRPEASKPSGAVLGLKVEKPATRPAPTAAPQRPAASANGTAAPQKANPFSRRT